MEGHGLPCELLDGIMLKHLVAIATWDKDVVTK